MLLTDVLKWIKTLDVKFDNYYIGALDNKKNKSLGVYNLKRDNGPVIALGGLGNTKHKVKRVSLLIHWNNASDESEKQAIDLYECLMCSTPAISGYNCYFIGILNGEPVSVGRDENGVCEYVIEFEIYYYDQIKAITTFYTDELDNRFIDENDNYLIQ